MRALRSARFRHRLLTVSLGLALGCAPVGLGPTAMGQEAPSRAIASEARHDLEGGRFVGPLAVEGERSRSDDVLIFEDGKFWSRACLEYGFTPAPYWVRRDADGLHFRAELQSPEHGTMRFEGVFDGVEMRASALWTKKRWYWTIEQELRFTGRPLGRPE